MSPGAELGGSQNRISLTKREAESALEAFTVILDELGLKLKPAKTRIVHLREGGEGLDFLGFHHCYVRGNTRRSKHLTFLARCDGVPVSGPGDLGGVSD